MPIPHCFSIVIPVLNNADRLERVLAALEKQDYPKACYEVIVVDNGSDDRSDRVAKSFDNTICLKEHVHKKSPYSARNRGVEVAKFEIIAFLDATCTPGRDWLSEAARSFGHENADLVSGPILFELPPCPGLGEIYDSLFNVNTARAAKKGRAPCANLFLKKRLIEEYGMFEEGARSGEDYRLTGALTAMGHLMVYNRNASVYKATRNKKRVIDKQKRVARGQVGIWRKENRIFSYLAKALYRALIPPNPAVIWKTIGNRGRPWMYKKFVQIYFFRYYINFIMFMENIRVLCGFRDDTGKAKRSPAKKRGE